MKLILVTGLSGAGKSQALNCLEDMGYFCVDNLPPALMGTFVKLCAKQEGGAMERIAIGVDVRGKHFFREIYQSLYELRDSGVHYEVLFMNASDEVLIKRYKETRRTHPLAHIAATLPKAIAMEREQLARLRQMANCVVDTSQISVKQLYDRIRELFIGDETVPYRVTIVSFGFKYGLPQEADLVFDMRFLPNPFYIDRLKQKNGKHDDVREYVLSHAASGEFIDRAADMLLWLVPKYMREGRNELIIAVGCTGGMHRSVVIADQLQEQLIQAGASATVTHRDIERAVPRA